jgi:hypothetical protein
VFSRRRFLLLAAAAAVLGAVAGCAPKRWALIAPSDPAEARRRPENLWAYSVVHEFDSEAACLAARDKLIEKVAERAAAIRSQGRLPEQADIMSAQADTSRCVPAKLLPAQTSARPQGPSGYR